MIPKRLLDIAVQIAAELKTSVDRLPYTEEFDEAFARFQVAAGETVSKHDCWWAMQHARKNGMLKANRRKTRRRPRRVNP
jgi:hypothetical protein